MSHPVINVEFLAKVSRQPGVYVMKDDRGGVLYVGKARDLRKRLASYARPAERHTAKTGLMLSKVETVETLVVNTEKEALLLESSLIKKLHPRFNIILRDDKSYPYLKVTVQEQWPRLVVTRRPGKDGARCFGPFSSVGAMWETVRVLNRLFPLRRCKQPDLAPRDRPCLNYQIKRCLAPCFRPGEVEAAYRENVRNILLVLEGKKDDLRRQLEGRMKEAAADLDFETAALLRDQLAALAETLEKQIVATRRANDQDVFAVVRQGTAVAVSLLMVRKGVLEGQRAFLLDDPVGDDSDILAEAVSRYYGSNPFLPNEVLLALAVEESGMLADWLTDIAGHKVSVVVPERGLGRRLVELAAKNGERSLAERDEAKDSWAILAAAVQKALHLAKPPISIECLDISNLGGRQTVGSLVRFEEGKPCKGKYRSYHPDDSGGPDDYAMIGQVVGRRFDPGKGRDLDLPDLLLVDGGRGQVSAAARAMADCGVAELVPLAGIAKAREEGEIDRIFLAGRSNPLALKHYSPVLLLMMQIRDEAHRFGISRHRRRRGHEQLRSALDDVPGIGSAKKRQILKHFGGLAGVSAASIEELQQVPGIGPRLAALIHQALHP
ncbi:MAG: excinuclease ABC subunit UvrC [Thermodesulfobacteriota bacterium]